MPSISISSAKDRFAAIEKSKKKALTDEEERAMKVSEKTSRLKALRLAKEAIGKELLR
ncbi:hypothetical protein GCM10007094_22200 [Pseudovibrio japonicus]|uniref:Uncharacterized protein n=1 Tax=Pseudovibrio japonicus TaxID=366534 RepID=A0ABQ3EDE4_9HYPH|nr:hypothetical protein [Pseudovibrio japonicus]GHB32814.1 hypothetical protein GCM10007094_22200 [Pseudovibrio japonicus]